MKETKNSHLYKNAGKYRKYKNISNEAQSTISKIKQFNEVYAT